jgi:hypothetical protein
MDKKMIYVVPSVKVSRVTLEGCIAAQSVVRSVEVMDWEYDDPNSPDNNADIFLPF